MRTRVIELSFVVQFFRISVFLPFTYPPVHHAGHIALDSCVVLFLLGEDLFVGRGRGRFGFGIALDYFNIAFLHVPG